MIATSRLLRGVPRPAALAGARRLHALIMGPPGGGKGTLSKRIETDFGFTVLSAGDVLRAQVAQRTPVRVLEPLSFLSRAPCRA